LQAIVRWLGEALVRLYYPKRIVEGAERIPAGRPVVFVLNHPNGLLDPVLLRVATGRPARFLAKSTLFGNPLGRLAMSAFGSIPIYRAHESGPRAGDASRNDESFARCRAELAAGGAMALFPEGASHSDPQLRPLKTGAARIALSAEAEHDGRLGVVLVPVGLHYERKTRFRSSVLLAVGEPIEVAPLLAEYTRDERATVTALTERIDTRLDEVVLQAETREIVEGIARVARWTASPDGADGDPNDPAAQHRRARELGAAYARMRARDPARVEAIVAEARRYRRTLERLGVRDPWALELTRVHAFAIAGAMLRLVAAAPLALVGALMGWIPYRLAGRVAGLVTREADTLGTVKLFAGVAFLFIGWTIEAVVAGVLWGAVWAVPTFVVGVATGYVALRFEELAREAAEAWRHVAFRALRFPVAQRLVERRRELADTVARALEDAR
jgi:1-acyl-sn-glycerol-3-phosphate acyltransferase